MPYLDKSGMEIEEGMYLRMEDGRTELVYACFDRYHNRNLGISISDEQYLRSQHPGYEDLFRRYRTLDHYDLGKVEICQPELTEGPEMKLGM